MIGRKVKKLFVFSLTAALVCALSSCDNLGTDDNASSLALVQNVTAAGEVLETRTFSGSVDLEGLLPQEFAGNSSAQENGGKTLFPSTPTSSSLTYSVSAACGTKGVTGSVNTTTNKFTIAIPFTSTTESWKITLIAKSGSNIVLKSEKTVTYSTTGTSLSMPLNYYTGASTETGGISLSIPISTSGTTASGIQSASVSYGPVGETPTTQIINVSGSKIAWTKTGLAPGAYKVQIFFYSGTSASGSPLYVIDQQAMVYSNLTTSVICWHGSSKPEYATSTGAFETITKTMADNQKSVSYNGEVYLGGTGLAGKTASDSNSGSAFAPVLTLYKALEIVNGLAATDASKEYVVHVKADVAAGTGTSSTATTATATVNSGVKVKIIGDQTSSSSWRAISGGTTAGTYKIISNGTVTVQYLNFSKLASIQVAAGMLTINDCSVAGGDSQSGFLVSSGATLKSTQGLTISNCRRAAGGGGIFCEGTLTLTGTTISGCRSLYSSSGGDYSGCGGALLIGGASASASLSSCTIGVASPSGTATSSAYSNYAGKMGGGIYIYGGAAVTLGTKTTVQYNCAAGTSTTEGESGGGGVFVNNGTLSLTAGTYPVTIGYNYASTFGGGLCISSSCVKAIELKGYFYKNSADKGGAIYTASGAAVTTPTATASAPNIGANGLGNKATTAGGGIYIASTGVGVACANIDYNTAASGAGVYLDTSGSAIFTKGYITNNTASSSGGGIYNKGSLYLCGVKIQSNKATSFGGGIYTDSKVCLYTSGSNWTDIGGSSSTYANKTTGPSGQGGGVYVADGGLYLGYSEYEGSTKTTAAWGGKISANTANMGGGVYVNKGELVMRQGMIGGTNSDYANTSTTLGGGVYMQKDTTFQITGDASGSGSIRYNTAGTAGGGVYCLGTLNFDYGNIVNNTATTVGDGVCLAVASSKVGAINLGSMAYMGAGTADANDIFLSTVYDPIDGSSAGTKYNKVTVSDSTLSYKFMISIPSDTAETWLGYGVRVLNSTGGMTLANALKKFSIKQLKNQTLEFTTASGFGVIRVCANYAAAGNVTLPGTAITNPKTSGIFIAGRTFKLPKILASRYECTQGEYEKYCRYGSTNPSSTTYGSGDNYPVYYVSWYDAIVYCNLRSMAEGLDPVYSVGGKTDPTKWTGIGGNSSTGYYAYSPDDTWKSVSIDYTKSGWRLPFEVEWEYLARDGILTNTGQYYYSGGNTATDVGWIYDNAEGSTHPVGGKTPTTNLHMYDMTGNVWEWTNDWHIDTLTTSIGLTGPSTGSNRQARNSGYRQSTGNTLEYRNEGSLPTSRFEDLGFRIVRTLE